MGLTRGLLPVFVWVCREHALRVALEAGNLRLLPMSKGRGQTLVALNSCHSVFDLIKLILLCLIVHHPYSDASCILIELVDLHFATSGIESFALVENFLVDTLGIPVDVGDFVEDRRSLASLRLFFRHFVEHPGKVFLLHLLEFFCPWS